MVISAMDPIGGVILTGGGAVRLHGAEKASVEIGGQTLLEHALDALRYVGEIVVVGKHLPTTRPVTFVREDPVGGGPAAGLLTGLSSFARPINWVVALAVDMPLVSAETIQRLAEHLDGHDGALLKDSSGKRQFLCAIYRVAALREQANIHGFVHGISMKQLVEPLDLVNVAAVGEEARDVDTMADIRDLRELLG